MAEEIKKVISIDTKGADTVKDLIDKVEKLRGILKNLDETSDEYKTTLGELKTAQDSLTASIQGNTDKVTDAEGSYNALSKQMRDLKKEWKATNDEAKRVELGKEIKGINDQLKTLDQSIGNNQRNVGNYAGSFQSLKEEIRQARDVMAGAARGSDEYAAAAKRAAEASNQLRDMQKEIAMGSAGLDNKLAVTSTIMSSISGGFAAAQGAMALFGAESENLQKTFVKLQAAMSMTQGFKALAELPKALNAAKIAFGGVTTSVKAFTKSLTGVKGAIAATGIGLLLVLLGELIANWDTVTEAVYNFIGGMDGLTEKLAGVANVIKNFITGPIKALGLAFKGQFTEAWEAMKNGFKISANYVEGKTQQMVRNTQKAEQKKRQEYDKTKDDYIKDMEAQYGADWKYTKEGEKAYRDYYNNKLSMYKKDSEEYKKAQREMWAYERELKEKNTKTPGGSGGSKNKSGKTEADKEREKEMQRLQDFLDDVEKEMETGKERAQRIYNESVADLDKAFEAGLETVEGYEKKLQHFAKQRDDAFAEEEKKAKEEVEKAALEVVNNLRDKADKELRNLKADIIGKIFPTEKDVQLALKDFKLDEAFSRYMQRGKAKFNILDWVLWDINEKYGIDKFFTDLENRIMDLQRLAEKGSMYDLLLGEGSGSSGKGAMKFADLVNNMDEILEKMEIIREKGKENTEEAIKEVNSAESRIFEIMLEVEKEGLAEQEKLIQMSIEKPIGWFSNFFNWRVQKGDEVVEEQIAANNRELASYILTREQEIQAIQEQMRVVGVSVEEMERLALEAEEIKREEIEKTAEIERRNAELTLETIKKVEEGKRQLIAKTAEAIGNTGDLLMNWSDNIVKNETKNGKTMTKEKEKQAERMFNVGKALAISEAVISTYQGAQEAFTSLASIPYVGPALGIAAAAAAVTAGLLRIQSISSQKFGDNGTVSDTSSSVGLTSAVAVPNLEQNPVTYTSTVQNVEDEDKLNQPIYVKVTDIEDGLKTSNNRTVETSF